MLITKHTKKSKTFRLLELNQAFKSFQLYSSEDCQWRWRVQDYLSISTEMMPWKAFGYLVTLKLQLSPLIIKDLQINSFVNKLHTSPEFYSFLSW